MLAVPFDVERGVVEGEPVTLAREVVMDTSIGIAQYAFSASGSIVFVPGPELARGGIAWIDRDGSEGFLAVEEDTYGTLDLDAADRSIAISVGDVDDYVRVIDIATGRTSRMPQRPARASIWSSSGDGLAYTVDDDSILRLESFDPSFSSRSIELGDPTQFSGCSPDDRLLAGSRVGDESRLLDFLDVEAESWTGALPGEFQWCGSFSPDGEWLAYVSRATGNYEVHVRSFPGGSVDRQISDGGAVEGRD